MENFIVIYGYISIAITVIVVARKIIRAQIKKHISLIEAQVSIHKLIENKEGCDYRIALTMFYKGFSKKCLENDWKVYSKISVGRYFNPNSKQSNKLLLKRAHSYYGKKIEISA